jgi:hypothetical protein
MMRMSPRGLLNKLDFCGTGPVQSLHEMATQIGLLVGDEFVVTEIYRRFAHYRLTGGPNLANPLALFNFEPPPATAGGNPSCAASKA